MNKEEALKQLKQIQEVVTTFHTEIEKGNLIPTNSDWHTLEKWIEEGRKLENHLM